MTTISIKRFGLHDISKNLLAKLEEVFSKAYFNAHMYKDFLGDLKEAPIIFQSFLAYDAERIVGIAVLEQKKHDFVHYYDFKPIHVKRFTVLPEYRSRGIGKQLLDEVKKYAFNKLQLPIFFGESNELGSLAFYGREGALYNLETIKNCSKRNSPQDNIFFFKEFITDKKFRTYRYPSGDGVLFVFCNTKNELDFFKDRHFISKDELLNN